jgi:hypothetical protein
MLVNAYIYIKGHSDLHKNDIKNTFIVLFFYLNKLNKSITPRLKPPNVNILFL